MSDTLRFLVVEGTVRDGRKSIHAARYVTGLLQEQGHESDLYDMKERDVPLLQTRRYADPGDPPTDVEQFGQLVEDADGIVLVSPEYNHSYPGALKNLLDYLYPEYEDVPFSFVTVSGGGFGGVRAQKDLNDLVLTLNGWPGPSLPVSNVQDVFDADGDLVDEGYEERFEDFVERAVEHTRRFSG
ncbi:MAG: NAD(P)H-dependent oxidoreductase [Candidatus Nanohaloarchaea archaeon]|nr:NAD(P)H-dependent oxidoreductase [Candidatus Nanohaloarchaea archaeon]